MNLTFIKDEYTDEHKRKSKDISLTPDITALYNKNK